VVQGQRLMQPASDLFLGWASAPRAGIPPIARRKALPVGRDLRCRDAVDLRQDVRLGSGARPRQKPATLG
jgi:hypothetical protein